MYETLKMCGQACICVRVSGGADVSYSMAQKCDVRCRKSSCRRGGGRSTSVCTKYESEG